MPAAPLWALTQEKETTSTLLDGPEGHAPSPDEGPDLCPRLSSLGNFLPAPPRELKSCLALLDIHAYILGGQPRAEVVDFQDKVAALCWPHQWRAWLIARPGEGVRLSWANVLQVQPLRTLLPRRCATNKQTDNIAGQNPTATQTLYPSHLCK